eukprot:1680316-Amphidinium_carterae.1
MENGGDPPGTRRSASGRLINASTGRFIADPNKVKKTPSTRRANSRRSAPASENPADRSRSLGEVSDSEQNHQHAGQVPSTMLPDSAIPDKRHRLIRKTSMDTTTRVTERREYDQVQAQLRKGDPIRLGRPQERSPNGATNPLLAYLTQGREESVEHQTPGGQSASVIVDSKVMSPKGKGIPTFSICSNPTTPRDGKEDREDDEWGSICCLCGDIMQPGDRTACCRCTHQCHSSCQYICEGEVVCGHCKAFPERSEL